MDTLLRGHDTPPQTTALTGVRHLSLTKPPVLPPPAASWRAGCADGSASAAPP